MTPDNKARLTKDLNTAIEELDRNPFNSIRVIVTVIKEILDYL